MASTARTLTNGKDVRGRILDAAEEIFAARGFAAATTHKIGARAGVGKRMVFYYFPTKAGVYRAVLTRAITRLVTIHALSREEPGPVGLDDVIERITHFAAANVRPLQLAASTATCSSSETSASPPTRSLVLTVGRVTREPFDVAPQS